ncbi:MAG: M17 family peptidase N-terminal domain-containing protein [bacterium]|nr:M17 family peptidase N-terminal domain-containing protein [bacterium]MDT8395467.1 M17 family peptidase N-terminal domain-containing protein [bacterium]
MGVQVRGGNLLNFRGDALLLFHHSDVRPLGGTVAFADWRLNAAVSILWKRKSELFRFGQLTVVATQGKVPANTIILTGLGAVPDLSSDLRREAYRLALQSAVNLGVSRIAVQGINIEDEVEDGSLKALESALASSRMPNSLKVSLFPDHRVPVASQVSEKSETAKLAEK